MAMQTSVLSGRSRNARREVSFPRENYPNPGKFSPGGRPMPCWIACISRAAAWSALLRASLNAAVTRSSRICLSSGTIRLSSIDTPRMRPLAVQRILTSPPPETPSTSSESSLAWASPICFWMISAASWAFFIISFMSMAKSLRSSAPVAVAFGGVVLDHLGLGKGRERRFDQRVAADALGLRGLRRLGLLAQRRRALAVAALDLPALAGGLEQRVAQLGGAIVGEARGERVDQPA